MHAMGTQQAVGGISDRNPTRKEYARIVFTRTPKGAKDESVNCAITAMSVADGQQEEGLRIAPV
jgi:hypothetical protein